MESLWIPSSSSAILDEDFDGWCHHNQPAGKKRRLTATQVEFLERSFEVEDKLDSERKLQLAKQLGLQPRQVAIWFQNRRARSKNKQLEKDYDLLRASFDKLKADFDHLLKEKDGLQNEVVILKEKLLIREKGIVNSSDDGPQNPNSDTSNVPMLACKHEEACSAKSDVFESNSPCFTDGMELVDSSNVFEPDHQSDFSQDEEDDRSLPLFLPKFDCYHDAPLGSCSFSLPAEDQSFWSSLY
ncbi:homeobox 1, conserved peptide upstream open reading frame 33 [Hibiscus trionum]|uniref:Homeobox-leucine zipper protein n=1 Tax=Hibiscus trionum TaxID=183268 RepID=A0A9W7HCC7_HIBTR|nr:homeobox 1, conserved peptide upstream open reading frame 33 [Hibiscus trionum]